LVARIREVIPEVVPVGAIVAVASKGDPELVLLPGRHGWHFPRDASGRYAGHYPPDGRAAVEHVEQLRAAGAGFLVFPATGRWWLEHDRYSELREHLESKGVVVLDQEGTCVIYNLAVPAPDASPRQGALPSGQTSDNGEILSQQAMDLVRRGVAPEATVITLAGALAQRQILPSGHRVLGLALGRTDAELLIELAGLAAEAPAVFVVPANKRGALHRLPLLYEYLQSHGRVALDHRHVCTVVELSRGTSDTPGRVEAGVS